MKYTLILYIPLKHISQKLFYKTNVNTLFWNYLNKTSVQQFVVIFNNNKKPNKLIVIYIDTLNKYIQLTNLKLAKYDKWSHTMTMSIS